MNKQEVLKHYRLTQEEYLFIEKSLGHIPSRLELALFSALWSEHCSYKSSAVHLKKLFFDSPKVLSAQGENAGVVDIGREEKVAFKVESHNHPSRITPYHGAATGVGGILRDVFVMNARPIALANYLCFGTPSIKLTETLLDGVVQGIGGYGNSIGIPTITGQTEFDSSYNENIVVNALALGYFGMKDNIISSQAKGPGNLLVYVGARTGKDGIHGASMASESFKSEKQEDKKTCVQIGDPFYGKLLMEACLEVMRKKLIISAQDMGAAGLTSSSFEMISKGKLGMCLQLDQVPLRDFSMTAEEILLSESQERVLLVVQPEKYNELKKVFVKWGLPVSVIGQLTKEREVKLLWKEKLLLKIDPRLLEKAPRYNRPYRVWKSKHKTKKTDQTKCVFPKEKSVSTILRSLLKDARGSSRKFIYRQYDQRVGGRTIKDCSFPLGVVRLPESGRALSLCMGGRPHIMRMDSLEGGKDSVYEPALQLSAQGFTPLALTDGLNFGSPEKENVMSAFVACVEGIALSSRSLKIPVVSGNVSFYNETKGKSISPTPITALIGVREKKAQTDHNSELEGAKCKELAKKSFSKGKNPYSEKKFLYLVRAHQIFCKGLIGEVYKQPPAFYGSLNPKVCADFIHQVLKASTEAPPCFVRLVGKFGLAYSLARILLDSSFCSAVSAMPKGNKKNNLDKETNVMAYADLEATRTNNGSTNKLGIEVETHYDPFQERLYELILILKESDVSVWEKYFSSTEETEKSKLNLFKMEKLGIITKSPVLSFNQDVLPLEELKNAYQTSFFS